jgi:hypothetical protein
VGLNNEKGLALRLAILGARRGGHKAEISLGSIHSVDIARLEIIDLVSTQATAPRLFLGSLLYGVAATLVIREVCDRASYAEHPIEMFYLKMNDCCAWKDCGPES